VAGRSRVCSGSYGLSASLFFRSLTVDAVCGADSGLQRLGIVPSSMELIVPQYLAGGGHRNRLSTFRGQLR
jgi:hypothetical protein